ncbi:MAG: hypothetical protein ACI9MC_002333 [Kiritimatiellia bacterium]|jgi:hypothetical protein
MGCDYIEARGDCHTACDELFSASGCDVPIDNPNISVGTAVFACTESCARREDTVQKDFVDCVTDNSCDAILDGECPVFNDLR